MNYHWIIDAGHGGIDPETNEYTTRGKRSPDFPIGSKYEGQVLYEGVRNRQVAECLEYLLTEAGVAYSTVYHPYKDLSLKERVRRANEINEEHLNCVYLSIHHNAYGKDWNKANGISTYHYPKSEAGFRLANVFQRQNVDKMNWRNRGVKSSAFYVLKHTGMPAVLTENGFMTNLKQATSLMSNCVSHQIAEAHFDSIKEINSRGLKFL